MKIQRVEDMKEAPVIGRFYVVRCVNGPSFGPHNWYPVIGPRHTDNEIVPGLGPHYHYDWRFISDSLIRSVFGKMPDQVASLLSRVSRAEDTKIDYRVRRCVRRMPTFPNRHPQDGATWRLTKKVEEMCEGRSVNPTNPVCPHRGFPLSGLPLDAAGCVVCPGHGLRFKLSTGAMVSRYDAQGEALP